MDLKILDKVITLCRKRGVAEITYEGITLKLGDVPQPKRRGGQSRIANSESTSNDQISSDSLSDEDLLYWSSQPLSEETSKEV